MTLPFKNICDVATAVGFDACSAIHVHRQDADAIYMDEWIRAGHHGQMLYLERNREARYDPSVLVPRARSMVVCLLTYKHSGHDYHRAVKSRFYEMEKQLRVMFGDEPFAAQQHIFCDSAPMLERRWAVEAGLGWIGKNRQLIHPVLGSMVHLGEMLLQADVDMQGYEVKEVANGCRDCVRCVEACPTGALRAQEWHAPLCQAYTTHHCLSCQINCPYNESIT